MRSCSVLATQFAMAPMKSPQPTAPPPTRGVISASRQDPVRSRLEGSQRDRTVLSAFARDAVAVAVEFREVPGRVLGDVADAVRFGLTAVVVWPRRGGNRS